MSKRHNRKRTRSRPRHREAGKARSQHMRTLSMDTNSSTTSSFQPYLSFANRRADHWDNMYSSWQARLQLEQKQALENQRFWEAQQLRFFGGEPGDEVSLLAPMLRVVTDLFDGNDDYEDP